MQKLNEKKILGIVPKKLQLVETFWDCPEFSRNKKTQKGITLIALIITIIVMLILVGVTINIALNGGLFSKAEEAGAKTKISQIQEALAIKEAELIADNEGVVEVYNLEIDDLELPTELKNEFSGKLIIGTDGKLYYDESVVTDTTEPNTFKSMGIQPYVPTPTPTPTPTSTPDPVRVPFANYIEDGNYYYVTATGDQVAKFSRTTSTLTLYTIEEGQVVESDIRSVPISDIIDKTETGYTEDQIVAGIGVNSFAEVSDDAILVDLGGGTTMPIIFKSNYNVTNIVGEFFTLNMDYQFPTE